MSETVTDLGQFYEQKGRKLERERIIEWLDRVRDEIRNDDSLMPAEQIATIGLASVLIEKLEAEQAR